MNIKVCDALCGAGKTSACINMMNRCTDKRYMFVTQFLDEVERIKSNCHDRNFRSPESNNGEFTTKMEDLGELIRRGENIATTHALFSGFNKEIRNLIREKEYTLVLDEVVDVMHESPACKSDFTTLLNANLLNIDGNRVTSNFNLSTLRSAAHHSIFSDLISKIEAGNLFDYNSRFVFWTIPPDLFKSFAEVYVLTYMFESQAMCAFFKMYGLEYQLIGTKKIDGEYEFCALKEMNRVVNLRDKIHILNTEKLNRIGESRTDLSSAWYRKEEKEEGRPKILQLQKNITNVFKNIYKAGAKDVLWTTYKQYEDMLTYKGRQSSFIPYNMRASNKYADRHYLAYCVNVFFRPWEANIYRKKNVDINGDMYALSLCIQWIFRSAIRKGEEIWIYIPSARMRYLLNNWLENLAEGKDLKPIRYDPYAPTSSSIRSHADLVAVRQAARVIEKLCNETKTQSRI